MLAPSPINSVNNTLMTNQTKIPVMAMKTKSESPISQIKWYSMMKKLQCNITRFMPQVPNGTDCLR